MIGPFVTNKSKEIAFDHKNLLGNLLRITENEIEFSTASNKAKESVYDETLLNSEQTIFQDLESFLRTVLY